MSEGGDGVVEEHHAVARDDRVETHAAGGAPCRRVGDFETKVRIAGPVARRGDERFRQVDAS